MITAIKVRPEHFHIAFDDDLLGAMQELHGYIDRNGPHSRPFMFQVHVQFDIESFRMRGRIDAGSWPYESWLRPQPAGSSLVPENI